MATVDVSGAGDDPPSPSDKRFSLGKCIFHYRIGKKKNKNNGPRTEGEQDERKKRGGILHLPCFKPSTLDDDTTQEDQGRRNTEAQVERRNRISVTLGGGLDKNEISDMAAAVLMTGMLGAIGSSSSADPSRRTVTLRGGVPARLYNPTTLTEAMHGGEASTQGAQHGTGSIQPLSPNVPDAFGSSHQHGQGSAQVVPTFAASTLGSVDHGQSSTQA